MMRIHYEIIPTDYYQELCRRGKRGRRKAYGFLSYAMDGARGDYNSERFYAEVWGVSPSTAHVWIKEFNEELDRFEAARMLRRKEHERSVKKQSEQIEQSEPSKSSTIEAPKNEASDKSTEQIDQSEPSKDISRSDNNSARVRMRAAEEFFKIYRINNGKYTGSRRDAIEAYLSIDDVTFDQLLIALYAYRDSGERMVGAAKFIRDRVYLSYIDIPIVVKVGESWMSGKYNSEREVFVSESGKEYSMKASVIAKKRSAGELEFVIGEAA